MILAMLISQLSRTPKSRSEPRFNSEPNSSTSLTSTPLLSRVERLARRDSVWPLAPCLPRERYSLEYELFSEIDLGQHHFVAIDKLALADIQAVLDSYRLLDAHIVPSRPADLPA